MAKVDLSVYVVDAPQTVEAESLKGFADEAYIPDRDEASRIIHETSEQLSSIVTRQMESGPHGLPFYAGFVDPDTHTPAGWGVCCFPGDDVTMSGRFGGNLENAVNSVTTFDSNGSAFHGDVYNNMLEGSCTILTKDSVVYEGGMTAGQFNGAGRFVSSSYEYEGEFRNGKREGVGQLRYGDKKYTGGFSNDHAHGKGKVAVDMKDGLITVLSGSFIQGAPHGECTLVDSHNNRSYLTFDHGTIIEQITEQEKETRELKCEVSRLTKVVDEIDARECIICRDTQADTVIPQCGHVCMCTRCEGRLKSKVCPFCRVSYSKAIHLRFVS